MNLKSVIGFPQNDAVITYGSQLVVRGVAFDSGIGIAKVLVSLDDGKTWEEALLDDGKAGRYAYRAFRYSFKPKTYGDMRIMARAVDKFGKEQPLTQDVLWNHGGYKFNGVEVINVKVV